jgi:hypothetical protein
MVPSFDIFRDPRDKEPVWIEAAAIMDDAIVGVRRLGALHSGEYFIQSKQTGVEVSMTVQRTESAAPKPSGCSEPLTVRHSPAVIPGR